MLVNFCSLLLSISLGTRAVTAQNYTLYVEAALTPLMSWYDENNGLWNTTGWWNSANIVTMLGDLAAVDDGAKGMAEDVFANTLVMAQQYNLGQSKVIMADYMMKTLWNVSEADVVNPKGFLNGFYDDEGWWALAWIQAYDVTGNQTYLTTAVDIFDDMAKGNTTTCGGGIWWDKANTYVNAIANELYLSVASHLANRVPAQKASYVAVAQKQLNWFLATGIINADGNINDGLVLSTCKNNAGTVWSYNQGVILGALVELNKASANTTYLTTAKSIATAAITKLSTDDILHDSCEPSCGADGNQFKGVFMRNLQILQTAAPDDTYLMFMKSNADSIASNDINTANEFGVDWAGPFAGTATASTQSSAMDALVAAVAFETTLENGIASRKILQDN